MSSIFILSVALISLFLLTAYRPDVKRAPAARISANHMPVDVEEADLSAARWQAMGEFYEEQGMLTRDNFDYEQAADLSAARWQAMGEFYEEQGMLTRENFDYEQAADLSAARWQAMGEFYVEQASGINYAMDPVDLKLFNSAKVSHSTMAAEGGGIVYAMDLVDLKLFNSAEIAAITVAAK